MPPEADEPKSEKLGLNVTPTAKRALEFIERIHPGKYDGAASVLWDYSLTEAIRLHENARAEVAAS